MKKSVIAKIIAVSWIIYILSACCIYSVIASRYIGTSAENTVDMGKDPPEGYSVTGNVTYRVEVSWRLGSTGLAPNPAVVWIARLQNHSAPRFPGTPPFQISRVISNTTAGTIGSYMYDPYDDYNNSYDFLSATLNGFSEDMYFSIVYNITLSSMEWNIDPSKIGEYNTSDPLYINNTGAEPLLEADDPLLIELSNNITAGKTDVVSKARAIYEFVVNYLEYSTDNSDPSDRGAKWAYLNKKGDCSEFSDLMITLLRIQGIPARKVLGLTFVADTAEGFKAVTPVKGLTLSYSFNGTVSAITNTIPGHAWVEYYVPGYGWVACDPTWGKSGMDYFNKIDYIHMITTVGENYGGGIDPAINDTIQEFPISPLFGSNDNSRLYFDYTVKITVLDANIPRESPIFDFYSVIAVLIIVAVVSVVIYLLLGGGRRKKTESQEYYPDEYYT